MSGKLQDEYFDLLAEEGYRPVRDDDGDISFKKEGYSLYISIDENDPTFFRLVLPRFWEIAKGTEAEIYSIIDSTNLSVKAVKIYCEDGYVSASIEAFYSKTKDTQKVLDRVFSSLLFGLKIFKDKLIEKGLGK